MSKKTNTAKMKGNARTRQHMRKLAKRARGKRPNPAKGRSISEIKIPSLFSDPIFMHYLAGAILRYLELSYPAELQIMRLFKPKPPADLIKPEVVAESPDPPPPTSQPCAACGGHGCPACDYD